MALDPIKLLNEAREAVPAVNYALALAGLAASASIIIGLIGNSRTAILIVGLVFIGMVLIFLFSSLITAKTPIVALAGTILVWAILLFFLSFLLFTVTAFAAGFPCHWARILGLTAQCNDSRKLASKISVDGNVVEPYSGGPSEPNPGCQERRATSCVTPQHGGELITGTGVVIINSSRGRTGYEVITNTPQKICAVLWANTTACETKHFIAGYVSAVENFTAP
ncbi:hypothetical protein [Rhizobium sp. J15]|uniref:hypothetical protein n=1 Tax=Rhizobium sp. J15 TaxID=2035450 RepID=UPI0011421C60|nr:hypothetical protein [Rhizobium sp. J15]